MKKEVFIAIIVGFLLGLVITFGIYRAQQSLKQKAAQTKTQETEELTSETPTHQLTITSPEDQDIVGEDILSVSGITSKNSLVSIVTSEDQTTVPADDYGNFTAEVELLAGANQVIITSFDPTGLEARSELTIVYSTVDLDETETEGADQ